MSTTRTPSSEIISVSDLAWQERQPGVRMKSIWEHPESKRRAVMTRIEPDAKLPLHRHVGDELIFVIEGALSDEFGTVTAGNMGYRPDGCIHTISTKHGATVLAILTGGVEPVSERGSAPPSQVFALTELPWVERAPASDRSGSGRTSSTSAGPSWRGSSRGLPCPVIVTSVTS
jgi:hypothetical protein